MSKGPVEHQDPSFVPGDKHPPVGDPPSDACGKPGPPPGLVAAVLPAAKPDCTRTLTGAQASVLASEGVTCLNNATVAGGAVVRDGGSLVVTGGTINGGVDADAGKDVQLFGAKVVGLTKVVNATGTTAL